MEHKQRRNSKLGVKAKDAFCDQKAEESRFAVISKNHGDMEGDGLNAIKDN